MTRLHVGNISYETKVETLSALFSEGGRKVANVTIPLSKAKGEPRGFAYVEMASEEDVQAAITSCDGREIDGRKIRVDQVRGRAAGRRHE
jgi:RNA recognition motif-containing protein